MSDDAQLTPPLSAGPHRHGHRAMFERNHQDADRQHGVPADDEAPAEADVPRWHIRLSQVEQLLLSFRRPSAGYLFTVVAPIALCFGHVDDWQIGLWTVLQLGWWLLAQRMARHFWQQGESARIEHIDAWVRRLGLWTLGYALLWCTVPLVALPALPDTRQFLLTLLLITNCTITIVSTATHRQLIRLPIRLFMISLSAAWLGLHSEQSYLMAMWLVVVLIEMEVGLSSQHGRLLEVLSLSYRNSILAARVTEKNSELTEALRARRQLLAIASHDLRQPVHALGMQLEGWRMDDPPEAQARRLQAAQGSVRQLREMLNTLLDIGRIDSGGRDADWRQFDLQRMMGELVSSLSQMAGHKGLYLRLWGEPVEVISEPSMLRRMVWNLANNAIKFTHRGGVDIRWRVSVDRFLIDVTDTGPGIAAEHQETIFDEFRRLDGSAHVEGVGLGLAVVRRAARFLGGTVEVRSVAGNGSTFTLSLPLAPAGMRIQPVRRDHETQQAQQSSLTLARVLVVENNAVILEGTRQVIQQWGCEVRCASNAIEAVRLVADGQFVPTLILSDYQLGNTMDGLKTIEALRRQCRRRDILAYLITGDLSEQLGETAAAQDVGILYKPLRLSRLQAAVASSVGVTPPPDSDFATYLDVTDKNPD